MGLGFFPVKQVVKTTFDYSRINENAHVVVDDI